MVYAEACRFYEATEPPYRNTRSGGQVHEQLQKKRLIRDSPEQIPFDAMNVFRRGLATMATVKKPSKIVCIGRNYA